MPPFSVDHHQFHHHPHPQDPHRYDDDLDDTDTDGDSDSGDNGGGNHNERHQLGLPPKETTRPMTAARVATTTIESDNDDDDGFDHCDRTARGGFVNPLTDGDIEHNDDDEIDRGFWSEDPAATAAAAPLQHSPHHLCHPPSLPPPHHHHHHHHQHYQHQYRQSRPERHSRRRHPHPYNPLMRRLPSIAEHRRVSFAGAWMTIDEIDGDGSVVVFADAVRVCHIASRFDLSPVDRLRMWHDPSELRAIRSAAIAEANRIKRGGASTTITTKATTTSRGLEPIVFLDRRRRRRWESLRAVLLAQETWAGTPGIESRIREAYAEAGRTGFTAEAARSLAASDAAEVLSLSLSRDDDDDDCWDDYDHDGLCDDRNRDRYLGGGCCYDDDDDDRRKGGGAGGYDYDDGWSIAMIREIFRRLVAPVLEVRKGDVYVRVGEVAFRPSRRLPRSLGCRGD